MKKILSILLLAFPVIFAGCAEENTVINNGDIPVTTTATFTQSAYYSVLKTDKNTTATVSISDLSQRAGDTVTITFLDDTADNYTISQGFVYDDLYGIALSRNDKSTSINSFTVSVKNRLGTEILNKTGYIFSIHKMYPYFMDTTTGNNLPVPYPDNHVFTFNTTGASQTILFKQQVSESNFTYSNQNQSGMTSTLPVHVMAYGFDSQNLDNSTTFNNFEVDAVTAELDYNGTTYPNCLTTKTSSDCALKITNNNTTATTENTVFYLNFTDKYVNTAINLKSTIGQ